MVERSALPTLKITKPVDALDQEIAEQIESQEREDADVLLRYSKRVADELNAQVSAWWADENYPKTVLDGKEYWSKETTKKFIFTQTSRTHNKGEGDYGTEEIEHLFNEHDRVKNGLYDKQDLTSFIRLVTGLGEDPYITQPEAMARLEETIAKEKQAEEQERARYIEEQAYQQVIKEQELLLAQQEMQEQDAKRQQAKVIREQKRQQLLEQLAQRKQQQLQ